MQAVNDVVSLSADFRRKMQEFADIIKILFKVSRMCPQSEIQMKVFGAAVKIPENVIHAVGTFL